jgi:hypothetical protein
VCREGNQSGLLGMGGTVGRVTMSRGTDQANTQSHDRSCFHLSDSEVFWTDLDGIYGRSVGRTLLNITARTGDMTGFIERLYSARSNFPAHARRLNSLEVAMTKLTRPRNSNSCAQKVAQPGIDFSNSHWKND